MVKNLMLILLFVPIVAIGAPVLQLDGNKQDIDLANYLDIYRDASKILTFEQIQSSAISKLFKQNQQSVPNFGFTSNVIWLRFSLVNNSDEDILRLLQIGFPLLDSIIIYSQDYQGHVEKIMSGDFLPFSARDRDYRLFIFDLSLKESVKKTLYLRIQSRGTIQIPLRLLTQKKFNQQVVKQQFIFGAFYGLVLGLILYNLILYFAILDKSYLYYVLYHLSALGMYLFAYGLSFQFFWPNNTWLANHNMSFFAGNTIFWAAQFTRVFLDVDKLKPGQVIFYRLFSAWYIFIIFASFMPDYGLVSRMSIPTLGVGVIFAFYSATTCLLAGFRPARFYLIAFAVLMLSGVIRVCNLLGYLPTNALTEYGILVGTALEVILLSLALADRLNQTRIQRKMALKSQLEAARQTARLSETFKKFVPHAFLQYLNKQSISDVKLGECVEKNMSILFCDVRGFTTLSETKSPSEIFHFMNNYLTIVGPVVRENEGFIDKYIGDAIMALFEKNPQSAVWAGIKMLQCLNSYNSEQMKKGIPAIHVGIGLNTGPVMIGTLGEVNRMECTVISDAVNLASRLEGLTKVYGVSFLISQQTLDKLDAANQFRIRIVDKVVVKGRLKAGHIYEVYDGDSPAMIKGKDSIKALFEQAWYLYQDMAFERALIIFKQCQRIYPKDNLTDLYIERCQVMLTSTKRPRWDGITRIS